MDNKLQHLTDKLYQEGVQKGKEAADEVLSNAKKEAADVINAAKKEAADIVAKAQKQAADLKETTISDLRMASNQAKERLKSEIISLIDGKVVSEPVTSSMMDVSFVQKVIESLILNWSSSDNPEMEIRVPEAMFTELETKLSSAVKDALEKGFSVKPSGTLTSGFEMAPASGGFKMRFTDSDFDAYFQEQLRPKVVELLFENK
ncbi:hypothetical protein K5X82_00875 [Halosquirtibacter xylanolyticus]|uniref:hypothetical protein n=1 Tax=Halosquirtibacter xylanolyticus TaxID=3374599 RepID=UPI003748FB16|nr:hypothetical protein K5X82_00875 [Prolixibacteraceae bacterium]